MPNVKMTPANIEEFWKLYRVDLLPQVALAERFGISQGYVSKIVNGLVKPGFKGPRDSKPV